MRYKFLVQKPRLLPYVIDADMQSLDQLSVKAMEVYESDDLIWPLMLFDCEEGKVWRVAAEGDKFILADTAHVMYGERTKPESVIPL